MNLYLLSYNNYFNRIVKYENSLNDYLSYALHEEPFTDTNFNPNNGIQTSQVINWYSDILPDYMLVCEDNEIVSRWFIVHAERTRKRQYIFSLKRDLTVDYSAILKSSPCYIEKGWINTSNPLIYNSESLLVNQIKQKEILLKDETRCAWIVGYLAQNAFGEKGQETDKTITSSLTSSEINSNKDNAIDSIFTRDEILALSNKNLGSVSNLNYTIEAGKTEFLAPSLWRFTLGENPNLEKISGDTANKLFFGAVYYKYEYAEEWSNKLNTDIPNWKDSAITAINAYSDKSFSYISQSNVDWLLNHQNVLLKDSEGNYFKISVTRDGASEFTMPVTSAQGAAYTNILNVVSPYTISGGADPSSTTVAGLGLKCSIENININFQKVVQTTFTATIRYNVRSLIDAPYKMFCIPYPIETNSGGISITQQYEGQSSALDVYEFPEKEASLNLAMDIAREFGDKLYDLQLLPYCPARNLGFVDYDRDSEFENAYRPYQVLDGRKILSWDPSNENVSEVVNADSDETFITPVFKWTQQTQYTGRQSLLTYILWPQESNFSFTIDKENKRVSFKENVESFSDIFRVPSNSLDFKVKHETEFLRLTSPNYNGSFEFKSTSNNGIDYFDIDCTYKPYQPYIHVSPNFGGLYGSDFDDARGLILGGDFSLPIINDAWIQYQINNKSYEQSFRNQITNMEETYKIERERQKEAGIISAISAGITGAGTGALVGSTAGPVGALVGAGAGLISGGFSAYGLQRDLQFNEQLYKESKRYAEEQYSLSLSNIKALPYSLNKVSSFNKNNKYFPFIEVYSCTDVEKEAVRNRLTYRGFSINAIGTINDYLTTELSWMQGQVIQLPELEEDYELAVQLALEFNKGFYIKE